MGEMRPFQIILLSVFAVIAMLGLLLFANFQGFGRNAAEVGTVTIWGTLPQSAFNPVLTELKDARQEYANVRYVERQASTFNTDLADAIASGSGPDLIIISQEQLVGEVTRLTLIPYSSISERTFRDSYLPIFERFLTSSGTYGIPFAVDPLMLFYNRTLLATAGAARPPATWEAVTGLSAAITRTTDAQTVTRSLIPLGTYQNVTNARAILSLLFFQSGNSISSGTLESGLASTLSARDNENYGSTPVESALNFYTEFANPAKTTYTWNRSLPESRQMFVTGDLALYPGFASEQAALANANPNLDFDMAPMPQPGTATVRTAYARAYVLALPKATRNSDGAYEVALALAGKGTNAAFARALGMAPASRADLTPSNASIFEPVFYPEALTAKGWLSPLPGQTDTVFAAMIDNVNSGRQSVKQALSTADQALNAALR